MRLTCQSPKANRTGCRASKFVGNMAIIFKRVLAGAKSESLSDRRPSNTIRGFSAPQIYAADLDLDFALLEDFR